GIGQDGERKTIAAFSAPRFRGNCRAASRIGEILGFPAEQEREQMLRAILRARILNAWILQFRQELGVKLKKISLADRDQGRVVVKSLILPQKMRRQRRARCCGTSRENDETPRDRQRFQRTPDHVASCRVRSPPKRTPNLAKFP